MALALALTATSGQLAAVRAVLHDSSVPMAKQVETEAEVAAARHAMASMMRCVVNRSGYKIRKVLDLTVGGRGQQAPWAKLADEGCLEEGGSLRFRPYLMRGSVYLALYAQDFGKTAPITEFTGDLPVKYPVNETEGGEDAARYKVSMAIADCAVRKNPLAARKVVSTQIATDEERAAIRAFAPVMSGCIDAGNSITMNAEVVKGVTAEALYRLSAAKRDNHHA